MLNSVESPAKENANDIVKDERSPDDRELPAWMLRAARERGNEDAPLNRDEHARASPARNDDKQDAETSNLAATDRVFHSALSPKRINSQHTEPLRFSSQTGSPACTGNAATGGTQLTGQSTAILEMTTTSLSHLMKK